ncbi:MAG: HesA/MoeB/ThiF family protein [Candidatus Heimdallarchaeaceae archaeon]
MSKEERYDRQVLIPGWNQEALDESVVVIVGVGAIGSYVATIIASSGVGKIVLIEYDNIEISNLNRQLLFHEEDVGKPKVEVAAKRIQEINPYVKIETYNQKMETVPVKVYQEASVIIGCLDTFIGRRWINSMAVNVKRPLILGGMFAFLGDVQVIKPYETPCFECQPLVPDEELAQACTPFGEKRKKEREKKEEEAKIPAVATLSSIIGGFMAQEALKIILNLGETLENYLFYDGLHNSITIIPLARIKECPTCGELHKLEKIEFITNSEEEVKDLVLRLALTYGLEEPELMVQGKILEDEIKMGEVVSSMKVVAFALAKNLAKPIKIVLHMQD